jgi:hypothetical protein|tara:strand:+ start:1472 stop:1726 length:255 start_codon:yes stop_codon:yes gene_type:complete
MKMTEAPDISEVYRFPVKDMSWGTMAKIIEDLLTSSTRVIHDAVYHSDNLNDAEAKARTNIMMAYNYIERWVDAYRDKLEGEPF